MGAVRGAPFGDLEGHGDGGLQKGSISLCGSSIGGAPFGDLEGNGEEGSVGGHYSPYYGGLFTGNLSVS